MPRPLRSWGLAATLLALFCSALPASAQYFGRNKVQYDNFEFRVFETDHFIIHFYGDDPESEQAIRDVARMAERWYRRHSRTFLREFREKKPLIFYSNDADFYQTNIVNVGQGTGGVTEGAKQRVVMPLTGIYEDTVHELVHSFQYDIGLSREDSTRFALGALPLWFIEGMAEYLTIGRQDPHTAMWMRDAVLQDDIPTTDDLASGRTYFPYRYGQALLAYVGGKYGDGTIGNLYKLSGRTGLDSAFVYTLGITPDSLSTEWAQALKETYLPLMEGRTDPDSAGRPVLSPDIDAGSMNISPVVSPDGRYVAFLSERDLFNINLFIADAETGEVIERLGNLNTDPEFDALRFIASAGSWSPDGRRLAFVTFDEGDNAISIWNVDTGDIESEFSVEGIGAASNPAWSPDGRRLAFSGIHGGISDLYVIDLETRAVRQLTDDRYADTQPTWSPDGRTLAFTTDRGPDGSNFETLAYAEPRLALMDVETNVIEALVPFPEALHHNPQFSRDGRSLYFISTQSGFQDVYRLELASGQIYQVTNLKTGVSGISNLSPAMSVAAQSGRMMFSVYGDGEYTVFALEEPETMGTPVEPLEGEIAAATLLPPIRAVNQGLVGNYLDDPLTGLPNPDQDYDIRDYKPRLQLDYVAPPTIGASVGGPFGGGVYGGVGFFFSDMLGNHNLTVIAQANGTIRDIGGQAYYVNRENRLNWGAGVGHIPLQYLSYGRSFARDDDGNIVGEQLDYIRYRIFIDQASVLSSYPLSTTKRIELTGGFVRYGFHTEVESYIFTPFGVARTKERRKDLESDPAYYGQAEAAFVGDFSVSGYTSPILGGRYRFAISPSVGSDTFISATADYRRYLYVKPFTFAVRGLHVGNYGISETEAFGDAGGLFGIGREYIGYPYYQGFVRGYNIRSFEAGECPPGEGCIYESLLGTRIATASAELRIPLFGPGEIALIDFPYLPTEIAFFGDAGLAWTGQQGPTFEFKERPNLLDPGNPNSRSERIPVTSAGISTRFNILGYMILEMYYAYPFQRPEKGAHFGFQLVPGW